MVNGLNKENLNLNLNTLKVRANETPFVNGELRRAVRVKTLVHNIYRKRPTKHNWERSIQPTDTFNNKHEEKCHS